MLQLYTNNYRIKLACARIRQNIINDNIIKRSKYNSRGHVHNRKKMITGARGIIRVDFICNLITSYRTIRK